MAILYIVLVLVLFGWALLQRTRGRRRLGSSAEPLLDDMVGEGSSFANLPKDGTHPAEVCLKACFVLTHRFGIQKEDFISSCYYYNCGNPLSQKLIVW